MARNSDPLSDSFGTDDSDGWLGGLVADEDSLDRRTLWRLGLWGAAAVGALTLGILSGQLPVNAQRTQLAANEFAGRARQVETTIHENQLEAKRLAAAIETLNTDRDRLFNRLSSIEQGLDVVTGSIKKADEKPATTPAATAATTPATNQWPDGPTTRIIDSAPFTLAAPAPSTPPQTTVAVASTAAEPERMTAASPPRAEPAPAETSATAAAPPASPTPAPTATPPPVVQAMPIPELQAAPEEVEKAVDEMPVAALEFGVDLGNANSISGLRALWRGLVKSHKAELDGLRPLIAVHERRNGLGLQLRLIAGPIRDAATVARICAVLDNANRDCKTSTFDGQRLSLAAEPEQPQAASPAKPPKPRRSTRVRQPKAEVKQTTAERQSALSTMLGIR